MIFHSSKYQETHFYPCILPFCTGNIAVWVQPRNYRNVRSESTAKAIVS